MRTRLAGPTVHQAFLGEMPLSLARWPNADFRDTWRRSRWAQSAEGSQKDLMVCDALAATGIDWTGAVAVLNVGHQYKTWTRRILSHGKGKRSFTYALEERLGDGKDSGKSWWNDRFFITDTIKALDAAGAFFHDRDAGYFFLVTSDGETPYIYRDALLRAAPSVLSSGQPDARPRWGSIIIDRAKVMEGLTDDYTGTAPDVGAYEFGKPGWRAGAARSIPRDIALPIEAEVARSWKLGQNGKMSIPLPRRFRESKLNDLSRRKLQTLYDSCRKPDEIEPRG